MKGLVFTSLNHVELQEVEKPVVLNDTDRCYYPYYINKHLWQ
ncbi:hypothetical protein QBE52_12050 [Clostridiaceae bacterium 35-E11]